MIRPVTNYGSAVAQAETRRSQVVGTRQHSCVGLAVSKHIRAVDKPAHTHILKIEDRMS